MKLITAAILLALAATQTKPEVGVGAYYREGLMREVCERRVRNGWMPEGVELDCDWLCLVSAIEPEDLGKWAVVSIPGGSLHL
jgi:hypothetical protein